MKQRNISIATRRWRRSSLPVALLLALGLATTADAQKLEIEDFSDPITVLTSAGDGGWHKDRYVPNVFETITHGTLGNVLHHQVSWDQRAEARPGGQQTTFYNTHGYKYNLGESVTIITGDLYIPANWQARHRRADIWATARNASDAVSAYPIVGFANTEGNNPTLRYYHTIDGTWVDIPGAITYDKWYTFGIEIAGNEFRYFVDGVEVGTSPANSSAYFGDLILQGYNFADPTLPAEQQPTNPDHVTYDIYWDNVGGVSSYRNVTKATWHESLSAAVAAASANDSLNIAPGAYTLTSNVNVNKALRIGGDGATISSELTTNFLTLSAAGTSISGMSFVKTVAAGNIIGVAADDITVRNNSFSGLWVIGDGAVSRAIVHSPDRTNFTFTGNTVSGLRQPAYLDGGSGTITNNTVSGSRGFVVIGGTGGAADFTFSGNSFSGNLVDIAITPAVSTSLFTDLVALSTANNNAFIEDQRGAVLITGAAESNVNPTGDDAINNGLAATPYATIQRGIDRILPGGTVNVYPGTYDETAAGRTIYNNATYQFGLHVAASKAGITVRGVDAGGNPVTDVNDIAVVITTNATNTFGYSGVFVEAEGVTFSGLEFGNNAAGNNKTIEVLADDFTVTAIHLNNNPGTGTENRGGALYFGSEGQDIQTYSITNSKFTNASVSVNNGAGENGVDAGRVITNNTFVDGRIAFSGETFSTGGPAWHLKKVGGAVITDNTFEGNGSGGTYFLRRGDINGTISIAAVLSNNTFPKHVLLQEYSGDNKDYSYTDGGYTFSSNEAIFSSLQGAIGMSANGDRVIATAGAYNEQISISTSIEVRGAQYGVDPRPYSGSDRELDGTDESIISVPGNQQAVTITAGNVVFDGFHVKHNTASGSADLIASPDGSVLSTLSIANNIISAATDEGIQLRKFNNAVVEKNYVLNSKGDGINMCLNATGVGNKIYDNQIVNTGSDWGAIYLYDINDVEISGNYIQTDGNCMQLGIHDVGASTDLPVTNINVHHNRIEGTHTKHPSSAFAIAIGGLATSDITIANNEILQVAGSGAPSSYLSLIDVFDNPSNVSVTNNYFEVDPATPRQLIRVRTASNTVHATCNWYGSADYADFSEYFTSQTSHPSNVSDGALLVLPFLIDGTDEDGGAIGFEPQAGACASPITQLIPEDCGRYDFSKGDNLTIVAVSGATKYEYQFFDDSDNVLGTVERNASSTVLSLSLGSLPSDINQGIYGSKYKVSVRAMIGHVASGGAWGDYGPVCEFGYAALTATTQLVTDDCGNVTLEKSDKLTADPVDGATRYEFRFASEDGSVVYGTSVRNSVMTMALGHSSIPTEVRTASPGSTFQVSVRAEISGTVWTEYGVACEIGFAEVILPTTQLADGSCGNILLSKSNTLTAEPVSGATRYEFQFASEDGSVVYGTSVRNSVTTTALGHSSIPAEVSSAAPGSKFQVSVRAQFGGTEWGEYGSACEIGFAPAPGLPIPEITPSLCGTIITTTAITASTVTGTGGVKYEFKFEGVDLVTPVLVIRNAPSVPMTGSARPSVFGSTESIATEVSVRAIIGGVEGDWSAPCAVEIRGSKYVPAGKPAGVSDMESGLSGVTLYPNPVSSSLNVVLNHSGEVRVVVSDMYGRVVMQDVFKASGVTTHSVDVSALSSGTYVLGLISGDETTYRQFVRK